MITEQEIISSRNNTPIGLAGWCWSADIRYQRYCEMAVEQNIEPLSETDFDIVNNWWEEQYYA